MKIVINNCYGGFGLSDEAFGMYKAARPDFDRHDFQIQRNDEALVNVVEKLGVAANGFCASLKIVEIPDGVEWEIQEYDGFEWVAEKHRTWY